MSPRTRKAPLHPDARILGDVVRAEREAQDRSQESVAHDAGLSLGAYARIDRGETDAAWSNVAAVADALGLSVQELGKRVDKKRKRGG